MDILVILVQNTFFYYLNILHLALYIQDNYENSNTMLYYLKYT